MQQFPQHNNKKTIWVVSTVLACVFAFVAAWKAGWLPIGVDSVETGEIADSIDLLNDLEGKLNPPAKNPDEENSLRPDSALIAQQKEPEILAETNPGSTTNSGTIQAQLASQTRQVPDATLSPMPPESGIGIIPESSDPNAALNAALGSSTAPFPNHNAGINSPGKRELVAQGNPVVTTSEESAKLDQQMQLIDEHLKANDFVQAHRELSRIYWTHPELRDTIAGTIDRTSQAIFFDPKPHYLQAYEVKPNDHLGLIAKSYNVPWEYLQRLNRIANPRAIRPGQELKVNRGPFAAVIDLQRYELTIHANNYYVRRFKIGIGKDRSTPVGKFTVVDKVVNPQYTSPDGKVVSGDDPLNPIGERWISLGENGQRTGYGIHGTIDPRSIGRAESKGCIRLDNRDVEIVYDLLDFDSPVVIRP